MAPQSLLDKARASRSYAEARLAVLRAKGSSLTAIATRLGVDRSYVSHVNAGRRRSPKNGVEKAIARALNLSLAAAFPERRERAEGAA